MKPYEFDWYWMEDEYRPGRPRTDKEFRAAIKEAAKEGRSEPEIRRYLEWAKHLRKDAQLTMRISTTDLMKLKALARMKNAKMRTYTVDILKRHILAEEVRLATAKLRRYARAGISPD